MVGNRAKQASNGNKIMNSNIDKQSDVSGLAMVSAEEVFTAEAEQVATGRGINRAKLLKRNLAKPIGERIDASELAERVGFARVRGNLVALHARIRAEVEPLIDALRQRDMALENL